MPNYAVYDLTTSRVLEYVTSSPHDPTYPVLPGQGALRSPDVAPLASVPVKYWKVAAGQVLEMTATEKAEVDADEAFRLADARDKAGDALDIPVIDLAKTFVRIGNTHWAVGQTVTQQNVIDAYKFVALPPQVTFPAVATTPGANVAIPVTFTARQTGISALQFDIPARAGVTYVGVAAGPVAEVAGKTVQGAANAQGIRVIIFGLNQNLLGPGLLCTITVGIGAGVPPGTYPIRVVGITASDADGTAVAVVGKEGTVTVQ